MTHRPSKEAIMVYVNDDQLEQVQYLLEQSTNGNHILFDNTTIKRIAATLDLHEEEQKERIENAESLLEQLILCPSIEEKKLFLENLDETTYNDVVRVYINVLHNTIADSHSYVH